MSDPIRSISQNNYLLSNGGGGGSYTAGEFIDITNDVISVNSGDVSNLIPGSGILITQSSAGTTVSIDPDEISPYETVLFENSAGLQCSANANIPFQEDPFNFERIKIFGGRQPDSRMSIECNEYLVDSAYTTIDFNTILQGSNLEVIIYNSKGTLNSSGLKINSNGTIAKIISTSISSNTTSPQSIVKVIGIGRKE